jgi:hypothetical protein
MTSILSSISPITHPKTRLPSRGDADAEEQYDHDLHRLNTTNRLYQSRTRVKTARGSH